MKSLSSILLCLAFLSSSSCTSAHKKFQSDLENKRCDEAMVHLPENDPSVRFLGQSKQALGTVASYTFVGFSYTAEVLWDVAGGTIMFVGMCGTPIVLSALANNHYSGPDGLACFPGSIDALGAPPLGRRARDVSASMRCPDLTSLSQSVRSVASCYGDRGGDDNRAKAKQVLESLKKSDEFYSCLSDAERSEIQRQLDGLGS